jgi:hypothetical protein
MARAEQIRARMTTMSNDKKLLADLADECALNEEWNDAYNKWFDREWFVYSAQVGRNVTFEGFAEHCLKAFDTNPKLKAMTDEIIMAYRNKLR